MLSTDREEFEQLMTTLCAAFNTPPTQARKDAYWRAFHKQSLAELAHLVDLALDESDAMPTVPDLRRLKYAQRVRPAGVVAVQAKDTRDTLLWFANRLVFQLMLACGGLGSTATFVPGEGMKEAKPSSALTQIRQAVLGLVDWFSPEVLEGDESATPALFIEMLERAARGVVDMPQDLVKRWHTVAESEAARQPFPVYMARDFRAVPQLELTP